MYSESKNDFNTQDLANFCLDEMVTAHTKNQEKNRNYRDFYESSDSRPIIAQNKITDNLRKKNARLMQQLCFWWWLHESKESNKKLLAWLVFRPDILNDYKPFHLTKDEQEGETTYAHHPDNPFLIIWEFLKNQQFESKLSNNDCNDQLFAQTFAIIATQEKKDISFEINVEQPKLNMNVDAGKITPKQPKENVMTKGWSDKIIYAIGKIADFFRWSYNSIKYFKTKKSLKKTRKLLENSNDNNKYLEKINQAADAATEILKNITTSNDFDINKSKEAIKTVAGSKWFIFNILRIEETTRDLQENKGKYVNQFNEGFTKFRKSEELRASRTPDILTAGSDHSSLAGGNNIYSSSARS